MPITNQLEQNVPGASLTDLHVGGPVAYVCRASDESLLTAARQGAAQSGLPVIEARGQVLVAPAGFPGLLILAAAPSATWSCRRTSQIESSTAAPVQSIKQSNC